MAKPVTSSFGDVAILVGDGATPTEAFTLLCGVTEKGISYSTETVETEVPDCANEDLPAFKEVDVKSFGISLDVSGLWTKEEHEMLLQWQITGAKKNVKVHYKKAASGDTEYVAAPAVLSNLNQQGSKGERFKASFNIVFASAPTLTAAA